MFENMDFGKMGEMLRKAQEEAKKLQDESAGKEFTAKSGGGLLKVTGNGKGEIIDIDIDDSLMEDKDALQILLISAINDLLQMIEEDKKNAAAQMLGGLGAFTGKF
ncbi:MAG TPA: YbaB/EbfC family nucleoid-associated protein [Campylobacteraceae bacterium]|nr:YbaB/EbfC family nucleoid-associated protein [Campylobacteraceae bacterium]